MAHSVYLTRASAFLPNAPVANEDMESVLGQVGPRPSRARAMVLRSNGIRSRHYAIDRATGKSTHTNAQLTAEAVRGLQGADFDCKQIEVLACGSSSPDYVMPSLGVMVHGELGCPPCEVVTASGNCLSGVGSFKFGFLSIASGNSRSAVVTGSEKCSSFMRAGMFRAENEAQVAALATKPVLAFEKDFLRWMLSDGAGAALLRDRPAAQGLSLKVEWVDQFSYANEFEPCMVAGAEKQADGTLLGWRDFDGLGDVAARSVMAMKQDVRLLDHGIRVSSGKSFAAIQQRRGIGADDVQHFLPHYSSEYFRGILDEVMPAGFKIPAERWFTNLVTKGNVGAASMYLMLEELLASGRVHRGERILCFVPESSRFAAAFVSLVAVAP
jgi:3-oxoacyl-[acyl-carrier-protein] synthase-3